ncbi:MAG: hypothetical protein ACE5E3_05515 [Mariprofundus sp.]
MTTTTTLMDELGDLMDQGIDPREHEAELRAKYGRTCAVLVLDSSGFTRTTREHGIMHVLGKLQQMREVILPILDAHGCQESILEADSVIALLPDVESALDVVLETADGICRRGIMFTQERPYRIGAGIGYGELLITGGHGEYFGPEINLASLLGEDTAQANQLLITKAAYASLPEERKSTFRKGAEIISGLDIDFHALVMEERSGLLPCVQ